MFHSESCAAADRKRRYKERQAKKEKEICSHPDCDWELADLNPTDRCTRHGGWVTYHNGDRPEAERIEDLRELLDLGYRKLMEEV